MSLTFSFSFALALAVWGLNAMTWPQIEGLLAALPLSCPLKKWTGLQCAFCGMTHSWIALFRGEWAKAFHANALGPLVFAGVAVAAGATLAGVKIEEKIKPWMGFAALGILTLYMIVRNLF